MAENHKKIVLTVKEKLQLTEISEKGELMIELPKDYRTGIE
jgi:hypothetical protein